MSARHRRVPFWLLFILAPVVQCTNDDTPRVIAHQVNNRAQLVGGTRALGDVGDFVLENEEIRVVIQGPGFSRGFGVYGGSLIDADLRRPRGGGTSGQAVGNDKFGELFPAFFLQAMAVEEVEVRNDGSNGEPAQIVATGHAGDFLEMVGLLNRVAIGSHSVFLVPTSSPNLEYRTVYSLEPGARHVDITFEVENISSLTLAFPNELAGMLAEMFGVDLSGLQLPLGDVALFGNAGQAFIPGSGFDIRRTLDHAYTLETELPALPGIVTNFIAFRSDDVSYALIAAPSERNFVFRNRDVYSQFWPDIDNTSMLLPFQASGFLGVYYDTAPDQLAPGEVFQVEKTFVVGSGDIGSAYDEVLRIRDLPTGPLRGEVFNQSTFSPADDVSVFVYEHDATSNERRILSQYRTHEGGQFGGSLEPGTYSARVAGEGRVTTDFVDFTIEEDEQTYLRLFSPEPARIVVHAIDAAGTPIPAKATAVGTYGVESIGQDPQEFLYDLSLGEHWRAVDLVPDNGGDEATRQYREAFTFTNQNGTGEMLVRPGTYEIVFSRGPEYDLTRSTVAVESGRTATVIAEIEPVVDTDGWISSDLHLHAINSIDSGLPLAERVLSIAGEGLDYAVSSDHNYVTDYAPTIAVLGLEEWVRSVVGIELTTLEAGHFNGYPLRYQPGPITHGSFEWSQKSPDEIFDALRELGLISAEETIVQVNHPRDAILGYYTQFERHGITTEQDTSSSFTRPTGPAFLRGGDTTFSTNFDAIEVLNGKLFWEIHHHRAPVESDPDDLPEGIEPGAILLDEDGDVAFPGAVDDWYNWLNLGERYIAVGTSDSHDPGEDEAGYFRTMVYVGEDSPRAVTPQEFVNGMQSRRVFATNGPMVDFWVNDPELGVMGSEIVASGNTVDVTVRVTAAPWISVYRINVVRNGAIAATIDVDENRNLTEDPLEATETIALASACDGYLTSEGVPYCDTADCDCSDGTCDCPMIDTWFAVEVIGRRSLFPVVSPRELPPLQLADAVAAIAGSLLGGSDLDESLVPAMIFPVTPVALTNPVWVRTPDGANREFRPPGVLSLGARNLLVNHPGFIPDPLGFTTTDVAAARYHPGDENKGSPLGHRRASAFESTANLEGADIRRLIRGFRENHGH